MKWQKKVLIKSSTWKWSRRTGRNGAVVANGVVKGVRPVGWIVLAHRQRGVVGEVGLVEHLKLCVAAWLQEGRPHTADVIVLHTAVQMKYLPLAADLLQPLLFRKLFPKTVPAIGKVPVKMVKQKWFSKHLRDRVGRHFVTFRVERLHLTVVGPLVWDVEGAQCRAAIRIDSIGEYLPVEVPVEVIDWVVKGDHHQLRYLHRL